MLKDQILMKPTLISIRFQVDFNDINICFTNKKRIEINYIKMKELYNKLDEDEV